MSLTLLSKKPFDLLGLGEVMLRLTPPDKGRIVTSESFEKRAGGSELNVMCGVAMLGSRTGMITKLPDNALGAYVRSHIRFAGVSDDYLVMDSSKGARLGSYYYEQAVFPRKPAVVYDRALSAFTTLTQEQVPQDIFDQTRAFHVSGITLGLGKGPQELAMHLIREFKKRGVMISFDVNYRANLWDETEARAAVESVLPLVDVLFVSEETSRRMLGRTGSCESIARKYSKDFGCKLVGLTMRTVSSPTRHSWQSLLYCAQDDNVYHAPGYTDIEVVDRIGSGDAFLSGVLAGVLSGQDLQKAQKMGDAMAAVKNTVMGDMPATSLKEIESVIQSHEGQYQGEMSR